MHKSHDAWIGGLQDLAEQPTPCDVAIDGPRTDWFCMYFLDADNGGLAAGSDDRRRAGSIWKRSGSALTAIEKA